MNPSWGESDPFRRVSEYGHETFRYPPTFQTEDIKTATTLEAAERNQYFGSSGKNNPGIRSHARNDPFTGTASANGTREHPDAYSTPDIAPAPIYSGFAQPRASDEFVKKNCIEIAPGCVRPLRGADETWECILKDFYAPVSCTWCAAVLCCIQDAEYVICPECSVISPNTNYLFDTGLKAEGGVGIGFTLENLRRWQAEIMAVRESPRPSRNRKQAARTA